MDNLVIASGIQTETTIAAGLKVSGTHADFTELAMNRLYKAVITAEDENGITSGQSVETGKPADPSPATVIIVK